MTSTQKQIEQTRERLRNDLRVYGELFSDALKDRRDLSSGEPDEAELAQESADLYVIEACE